MRLEVFGFLEIETNHSLRRELVEGDLGEGDHHTYL